MCDLQVDRIPYPLLTGFLTANDITISVAASNLNLTQEIENNIHNRWEIMKKEAESKNLNFYNGISYRLNNFEYKNEILNLNLSAFDFKHRFGLVYMSREKEIDELKFRHNGCFVGSTVVTSDAKYIMVKLSGKSLNQNAYDILGGVAETDIVCDSGKYIFNVLYQELKEEAGIQEIEIKECFLRMMYAGINGHIGFYFETKLTVPTKELTERFKDNKDIDIESIHFYSKEEYVDILKKHNPNKRMVASLL